MTTFEKIETKLPNGQVMAFFKHEDLNFPEVMVKKLMPAKDLGLQLKWIKEMEVRDDDVMIVAFPKTGTHWTWEIVNMVLQGSAKYQNFTKVAANVEFSTPEMMSSLHSPRVLNTHLTQPLLPAGFVEKKCKIIHVMRNPKDVVVSLYFHLSSQLKGMGTPELLPPFEAFVKNFRGGLGGIQMCSYLWYIKHWEGFQRDRPGYPILSVFYEDVKKNPEEQIKKIAKFLGKELDDNTVSEINKSCQFQNLKQAHEKKDDPIKEVVKAGGGFIYRKGTVGDWKNHFTVAESEAFDTWIEAEMKNSPVKFQFH